MLNNIPGIFDSIGRAAGLSSVSVNLLTSGVTLVATAAFTAWKNWDSLQEAWGLGIPPKAAEGVEGLKDQVQGLNKHVDELRKQKRLSLAESLDLEASTAKLKVLNDELQRQKDLKDLLSDTSKEDQAHLGLQGGRRRLRPGPGHLDTLDGLRAHRGRAGRGA